MLLGGRTAEELIFADPTTGAQNDIDRATTIARQMVTEFGMSDALGPMRFGHPQGEVFLGRDFSSHARLLRGGGGEHRRRGAPAHRRPRTTSRRDDPRRRTARCSTGSPRTLIEHETLEAEQVQAIFADVRPWTHGTSSAGGAACRPRVATSDHRRRGHAARADRPDGGHRVTEPNPLHAVPTTAPSRRVDKDADRARGARDPRGDRRGPGPRRSAAHAARASPTMYEEIFAGLHEDPAAPHRHVRGRPRRDGDGARHPAAFSVCEHHLVPFAGHGARRLHPRRRRPDHRAVEDRAARRRVRQAAAGAGAATTQIADALVEHAQARRACS